MKILSLIALVFVLVASGQAKDCQAKKSNQKLFCYYGKAEDVNSCKCTHVILPSSTGFETINSLRDKLVDAKILLTVKEFNEELVKLLEDSKIDGLEINLSKLDTKTDLPDFISTVKTKLGDKLYIAVSVPAKTETLAKYYDFKTLAKTADALILQTHWLGASKNVTFHPSRLSGLWDVQNTDSVVDLISGLGAPLSKLVISSPVQAFKFTLQNENFTAPGSPALELSTLTRKELCQHMKSNEWTLERDEDQVGPYIFRDKNWIAFEDATSIDIKAKYARVRGLAGLALKDLSQDGGEDCGGTILEAAFSGLSKQARAPRGAVLHSLEREILETPNRPFDNIQVSPYRITRVIDVEGHVNVVRQDTRTEFECSRQGYFVHPRSCGRFYRCVKFDQLSDEFSVFEFDCPAGLAFDERVEVCVWPGSLPDASACSGSSEIAPVPKNRFVCPGEPGYYADVENCRWFFACLDHGKSPLSAYEFRCPFGLVFDEDRLLCEWPWLVPKCHSGLAFGGDYSYKQEARSDNFALDLYDGLGTLSGIQLGGLAGKLEQPIAKTYSTFSQAKGRSNDFGNDLYSLNNAATLVNTNENARRFEYESQKSHEIDLQNYLDGQNYQLNSGNQQENSFGAKIGQASYINHNTPTIQSGDQPSYINYNHGGAYAHSNAQSYINQNNYNQGTSQSHASQESSAHQSAYINHNIGKENFENTNAQSYVNQNNYNQGTIQSQESSGHQSTYINHGEGNFENTQSYIHQNDFHQGGARSYAHQINTNQDNLKIVAGGYSGITTGLSGQNVEISQHGLNLEAYDAVTPVSLVSSTSIPTVTSLPIPSSTLNLNLDVYHGGVVANLPNLQHKLEHPSTINDQLANLTFYASTTPVPDFAGYDYPKPTISFQENLATKSYLPPKAKQITSYVKPLAPIGGLKSAVFENKFVKTELKPIQPAFMSTYTYSQPSYYQELSNVRNKGRGYYYSKPNYIQSSLKEDGYYYGKPYVKLQQTPAINYSYQEHTYTPTTYQGHHYEQPKTVVSQAGGYIYNKPAVAFVERTKYVEGNQKAGGYVYEKPQVAFIEGQKVNQQTGGYVYQKPAVSFVEQPKLTQHAQVNHGGYVYEKPKVAFEEPKVVHQQTITQGAQSTGYVYEKPTVSFVKQPKLVTQHTQVNHGYVYEKPKVVQQQTIVKEVQNTGYVYEKPAISFVEQPKILSQVDHGGYVYEKPKVVHQQTITQDVQNSGYVYEKPAVTFVEQPKLVTQHTQVNHGYVYEKPKVAFEEPKVVQQQTITQGVQNNGYVYEKPAISFVEQPKLVNHGGYVYDKPKVEFEEAKVVHQQTLTQNIQNNGYVYEKPAVSFVEQPKLVTQHAQINHHVENSGYVYEKPKVAFEEGVKVEQKGYVYNKPAVSFVEEPKTTIVHKIEQTQGYIYEKPKIQFEEKPQVNVQITPAISQQVIHSYEQPKTEGYVYNKPAVTFVEQPKVYVKPSEPAVVQNVYHHTVVQPQNQGYVYEKPAVTFVEQPKDVQKTNGYVYNKPEVQFTEEPKRYQKPVFTQNVNLYQHTEHKGYAYEKPAIALVEEPKLKPKQTYIYQKPVQQNVQQETVYQQYAPAITHTYQSTGYKYEKPVVIPTTPVPVVHHQYFKEAIKPVVYSQVQHSVKPTYQQVVTQPQIISSFSINQDTQQHGYYYNKPSVAFEEKPVQIYNPPPTIKTVQTYLPPVKKIESYVPPVVKTVETYLPPTKTVHNYLPPAQPTKTYIPAPTIPTTTTEVYEELIVPKKAYVTGNKGYQYIKPAIRFEEKLVYSTPKPTYSSTVASIVAKIEEAPLQEYKYYSYDNRNQDYSRVSTEAPIEVSTQQYVKQSRPIVRYEFSSLSQQVEEPTKTYIPVKTYVPKTYVPAKTLEPIYVPDVTPARTPAPTYIPVEKLKVRVQSRPIAKYEFSSLDSQYNQNIPETQDYVKVETPAPAYIPVSRTSKRPVKAKQTYLPPVTTTTEKYVEVTKPSREYLPVTKEIYRVKTRVSTTEKPRGTSKISREYLPVTTQASRVRKPSREYLPVVSKEKVSKQIENYEAVSTRRPKVVKVLKSKTIVKNNDFHPLLSTKLGAQCTCVSNTLTLRRKPQNKDDVYETQDTYENYQTEEVDIVTKKPTIVASTEPATKTAEVFTKKSRRPAVRIIDDEDGDEEDEENLKLVKSAVREGVREGIKQALATKDFDRYGPGGFRSRSETLQGTVDCQRAGLFRHPTQCNKFYSCRWDCVKKKFTLHVFNCPVHLTFDSNLGACNWPSQGPACVDNTLLPSDQ